MLDILSDEEKSDWKSHLGLEFCFIILQDWYFIMFKVLIKCFKTLCQVLFS